MRVGDPATGRAGAISGRRKSGAGGAGAAGGVDVFAPLLAPDGAGGPPHAAEAAAPVPIAALCVLPAEAPAQPVSDRAARRHGHAVLDALASLQLARLRPGGPGGEARATLAALACGGADAADPALRLILREIALRAAVELARDEPP